MFKCKYYLWEHIKQLLTMIYLNKEKQRYNIIITTNALTLLDFVKKFWSIILYST